MPLQGLPIPARHADHEQVEMGAWVPELVLWAYRMPAPKLPGMSRSILRNTLVTLTWKATDPRSAGWRDVGGVRNLNVTHIELAAEIRTTPRTVAKAIRALERLGYIRTFRGAGNRFEGVEFLDKPAAL